MRKIEGNYIYDYYYDNHSNLVLIKVFEKKLLLKKYIGEYQFEYNQNLLIQQTSVVANIGVTELIKYRYDDKMHLTVKEYYNGNHQLRYSLTFIYQQDIVKKIEVMRMGQFTFFETQNKEIINKMLDIVGKDFEGSFFLLDIIEKYENR